MKNVRVFYTKKGRMKFVSHLDMNRFMSRMVKRAKLPIWYTEGFHPHPYIAFALPLSLGFESDYEVLDLRLVDDDYPLQTVIEKLNEVFPPYVKAFNACEPQMKVGKIGFADFSVVFGNDGVKIDELESFLGSQSIIVTKKTKKGAFKEIDIAPKIKAYSIIDNTLKITLPAGSEDNLNPELLLGAFFEKHSSVYCTYSITRTMIYDVEMNVFK